jgi:hypothetical protein
MLHDKHLPLKKKENMMKYKSRFKFAEINRQTACLGSCRNP